jgi:GT2 family glycosyltransferase
MLFNPLRHPILHTDPERLTPFSPWHEHIPFALCLVEMLRPRVLVELGTLTGESYCALCQAVKSLNSDACGVAIGVWSEIAVGDYTAHEVLGDLRAHHNPRYEAFSRVIQGDIETPDDRFADGTIDLLNLVNLSDDRQARAIFDAWRPKLSARGVVLMHPIGVPGTPEGVRPYWEELRACTPHFEFWHQGGLGVLGVGSERSAELDELLHAEASEAQAVRYFFAQTADRIRRQFAQFDREEIEAILVGPGWPLYETLDRLRRRLFPEGGRKEKLLLESARLLGILKRNGLREMLRAVAALRSRRGQRRASATADPYTAWIAANEPDAEALARQAETAKTLAYRPLVSILVVASGMSPATLRSFLASVRAQAVDRWEVCLIDSCDNAESEALSQELQAGDAPIRRARGEGNRARDLNRALEMATGEFVLLADAGLLAPNALYEMVRLLNEDDRIDIISSDEDKMSSDGAVRFDPWFKPMCASPELLLSVNTLAGSLVRRSLAQAVGGFDPALGGAAEWDWMLRCSERTDRIRHIPKILRHRLSAPGRPEDKRATPDALRAIDAHLRRQGISEPKAVVDASGSVRVTWPTRTPKVSIIIPTKNKAEIVGKCLTSLLQGTAYPDFEVILVDNGSTEPETLRLYETLRQDARLRIVDYKAAFNYSAANNLGARHATGEILLFLNNDIEIREPDWLEEMARWALRPEVGVVGAQLFYPKGTVQHAGVIIGLGLAGHPFSEAPPGYCGMFGSVDWYRDYTAVTGACMMMRRELYEAVGGFDEDYILTFSDVMICVRLHERGYRVVYTPHARLTHHEGGTRARYNPPADDKMAYGDLHTFIDNGDPYYNPNLSRTRLMPTLAPPGEETGAAFARRLLAFKALRRKKPQRES